jgi:hypothetical protein
VTQSPRDIAVQILEDIAGRRGLGDIIGDMRSTEVVDMLNVWTSIIGEDELEGS